jgi:glucose-1-phosphate thymidylyltransferase
MDVQQVNKTKSNIVGLIPAAGQGARISPLPCSKELYPVGFRIDSKGNTIGPKVVCHYLLEKMHLAGITRVYIILRKGKWDIPSYLGDGLIVNLHIAYLMMRLPFGVPYTIDQAYPFLQDSKVVFGFPDLLFEPDNAFLQLLEKQAQTGDEVVLGLFLSDRPDKSDMVDVGNDGYVRQILIKPGKTHLQCTWGIAVWTPVFTQFIHDYLRTFQRAAEVHSELHLSTVIQAAIHADLRIRALQVSDKPLLDIGTAEDMRRGMALCTSRENSPTV